MRRFLPNRTDVRSPRDSPYPFRSQCEVSVMPCGMQRNFYEKILSPGTEDRKECCVKRMAKNSDVAADSQQDSQYVRELYTLYFDLAEASDPADTNGNFVEFPKLYDREEIRKKLIQEFVEDNSSYQSNGIDKDLNQSLQVCFVNDSVTDDDEADRSQECLSKKLQEVGNSLQKLLLTDGFAAYQCKLQAEVQMSLAQAQCIARSQLELEQLKQKHISPIAEMLGLQSYKRLTFTVLSRMNITQLQLIVNDLHSQIEDLSKELVKILLERDELNMEQDSILTDIEDLIRYLEKKEAPNCEKKVTDG